MGYVTPENLTSCPTCKSSDIFLIKSLSKYPITELFHNNEIPDFSITEVDQDFCICNRCSHESIFEIDDGQSRHFLNSNFEP